MNASMSSAGLNGEVDRNVGVRAQPTGQEQHARRFVKGPLLSPREADTKAKSMAFDMAREVPTASPTGNSPPSRFKKGFLRTGDGGEGRQEKGEKPKRAFVKGSLKAESKRKSDEVQIDGKPLDVNGWDTEDDEERHPEEERPLDGIGENERPEDMDSEEWAFEKVQLSTFPQCSSNQFTPLRF